MLSRAHRLTRGSDHKHVVRRGTRSAAPHTVTHVIAASGEGVRFGFIVGRNVGGAVVRNTVRRRLKAARLEPLLLMGEGRDVVIRALPAAADADFATLRREVERGLRRGLDRIAA